ncbi:hypothetical protein BGP_4272 [Beggiatoa sp. PS]|nr:hypothetical protein BGP_4272 [Beggiatoa sp. PS]
MYDDSPILVKIQSSVEKYGFIQNKFWISDIKINEKILEKG